MSTHTTYCISFRAQRMEAREEISHTRAPPTHPCSVFPPNPKMQISTLRFVLKRYTYSIVCHPSNPSIYPSIYIFSIMSMYVLKRNGRRESVHFDKITSRVSKLCYGLNNQVRVVGNRCLCG